jgi:hypothetical protein
MKTLATMIAITLIAFTARANKAMYPTREDARG